MVILQACWMWPPEVEILVVFTVVVWAVLVTLVARVEASTLRQLLNIYQWDSTRVDEELLTGTATVSTGCAESLKTYRKGSHCTRSGR